MGRGWWLRSIAAAVAVLQLLVALPTAEGSMYCGDENCYDVLGLTRKATDVEIKKAYRKLSLETHPDKNKSPDAPAKFQRVATAYEILSEPDTRSDYDYAIDHPEEKLYNQYRYYSAYYKKTVQVDVRVVIGGALLIFSALQYACRITAYNSAMKHIKQTPRYQHRLKQLRAEAEAEALASAKGVRGKQGKGKGKGKHEIPIDEEELEKKIDVNVQGGYSKPKVEEILMVWLVLLPINLSKWMLVQWDWVWRYWIQKQPYDEEAQIYLTCERLGIRRGLWDTQPEKIRAQILKSQIWIPENYKQFVRDYKNGSR